MAEGFAVIDTETRNNVPCAIKGSGGEKWYRVSLIMLREVILQ
nr:hypothetical protein [[Eubacterium] cellulosolvens]